MNKDGNTAETALPYALTRYITDQQRYSADANHADHKPFSQGEADEIHDRCVARWQKGEALIAEVNRDAPDDLNRCLRLYNSKHQYGSYDLVESRILGKVVLVPRYVALLEEMRRLRNAIA